MSEQGTVIIEESVNSSQNLLVVFSDPVVWVPLTIGIIGSTVGVTIPIIMSKKPKSHPTSTKERYLDYETGELILIEDYFVEHLETKFYKKVLLFTTAEKDRYEIWGYENGVFEKKILPYMIEDKKTSLIRKIKIKNFAAIIDFNITSFKVARYVDGSSLKDNVRTKIYPNRMEVINNNGMEVRNYIFMMTEKESMVLKDKSGIDYVYPKEDHWWGVIKTLPPKIGEQPGKVVINY